MRRDYHIAAAVEEQCSCHIEPMPAVRPARERVPTASRDHAPSLSAKSSRLVAAMSTGSRGAASPRPGPCSLGRAM